MPVRLRGVVPAVRRKLLSGAQARAADGFAGHAAGNRLEPKRLQFVRHHPGATVSLVLIEARLGAKPGLTLANDLLFYTDSGEKTADYKRLYHEET